MRSKFWATHEGISAHEGITVQSVRVAVCELSADRPQKGDKVQLAPGVDPIFGELRPGDIGTLREDDVVLSIIKTVLNRLKWKQLEDRRAGALSTAYDERDIVKGPKGGHSHDIVGN